MGTELRVIEGGEPEREKREQASPELMLRHFRNVTRSMMEDALSVWSEVYGEFEGTVTCGTMITADAKKGFKPECGWPAFLEKMRRLEHYLDHAKRISEGKA
jgi:peptide methionine sulfoxide reductase MsrB